MTLFRYNTTNSSNESGVYYECLRSIIALMDPDYYSCYVKFMGLDKLTDFSKPFKFSEVMSDFKINVRRSIHGGIALLSNYDDIVYTQNIGNLETEDNFREAMHYWKESYSTIFRKFCSYEFIGNFKFFMKILSIMMELRSNGVIKTVGELIDYLTSFYVLVSDSIEEDTTEMWLTNDLCLTEWNSGSPIDGIKYGLPNSLSLKEVITEAVNCILETRESYCSIDSLISLGDKYKEASGVALLLTSGEVKYLFQQVRAFLCSNRKIYNRKALVCSLYVAENIFLYNSNAAIYIDFTPESFTGIVDEPNVLYSTDTNWGAFTFTKPSFSGMEYEYLAMPPVEFSMICEDLQSYEDNQGGVVSSGRCMQIDAFQRQPFRFTYSGDLLELKQQQLALAKNLRKVADSSIEEKMKIVREELRSLRTKIYNKMTEDLSADFNELPVVMVENVLNIESVFKPEAFCFWISDYDEENDISETVRYVFKDVNSSENTIPLDTVSVAISCMLSYIHKECIDKSNGKGNGGQQVRDGEGFIENGLEAASLSSCRFAKGVNAFVSDAGASFDNRYADFTKEGIMQFGDEVTSSGVKEEDVYSIEPGTVTVLEAHSYWFYYETLDAFDCRKVLNAYAATTTESIYDSKYLHAAKERLFSGIMCNLFPVV